MLFVSEYVMLSPLDMTPDEKQNIPCYMDVYSLYWMHD